MGDDPSDDELRRALSGSDPEARLRSAWTLAERCCPPELAAAWGVDPELCATPEKGARVEYRRVFPMALSMAGDLVTLAILAEHDPDSAVRTTACQHLARAAAPDDAVTYAVLSAIAANDESSDVRAAVASNLRQDAPDDVKRGLKGWMRDGSVDVERAAVETLLATTRSPGEFLDRMRDEPAKRLEYALRLLREKHVAVEWSDVSTRIERRSFPVLLGLARLFAARPAAPPVAFWLRCAMHMKEIYELPEEVRASVMNASATACESATADALQGADDADVLHQALTVVAEALPRLAHNSYLELKKAGAIPYAAGLEPARMESAFARLWVAMIRLSPTPGSYVLRPRYR